MAGRRPIFATLVSDLYYGTRDLLFRITLEPASHANQRAKEAKKEAKKDKGKST